MNKEKLTFIFLAIIILVALFLRIFSQEDKWLCEDGVWVRHGNPSAAQPLEACGEVKIIDDEEEQVFVLEGQEDEDVVVDSIKNEEVPVLLKPQIDEIISSPLVVRGEAPGYWFFEANLPIKLLDESGNLISASFAMAQDEWMSEDLVPFEGLIEFNTTSTNGYLVIENDNPSGLPENSKMISFSVKFLNN